jgi:hypothetical protein
MRTNQAPACIQFCAFASKWVLDIGQKMAERAGTGRRRPRSGQPRRSAKREVPRSLGSGGRGVRGWLAPKNERRTPNIQRRILIRPAVRIPRTARVCHWILRSADRDLRTYELVRVLRLDGKKCGRCQPTAAAGRSWGAKKTEAREELATSFREDDLPRIG